MQNHDRRRALLFTGLIVLAFACSAPAKSKSLTGCTLHLAGSNGQARDVLGYVNTDGACVPRPEPSPTEPGMSASAQCRDGTYSYSRHRSGTCSHHGGVAVWR